MPYCTIQATNSGGKAYSPGVTKRLCLVTFTFYKYTIQTSSVISSCELQ